MGTITCRQCNSRMDQKEFVNNFKVCLKCGHHSPLTALERIDLTVDEDSFRELASNINSLDFLKFQDIKPYPDRLVEARSKSGMDEAIMVGTARLDNRPIALGVMDFAYMGGSMGSVVGEKIKLLSDHAIKDRLPLIIITASGGARMQEGIMSLMQMAKTVSCIRRLGEERLPFFSVITHPTTGGVSASFASIADIIIAEPGALFCFAGPRVVQQTIKKDLPPDFGTAERDLSHGLIDTIVERSRLRPALIKILNFF